MALVQGEPNICVYESCIYLSMKLDTFFCQYFLNKDVSYMVGVVPRQHKTTVLNFYPPDVLENYSISQFRSG